MPYYHIARLTSIYKKECKKLEVVISELRENGYKAYGTHFEGQAIKTNAPYSDLVKALFKK
jgi:tRNA G26 N,N-dimethylase Trm1